MDIEISSTLDAIKNCDAIRRTGKVVQFFGEVVESKGPDVFLGEVCEIYRSGFDIPVLAEVIGFREGRVLLAPLGHLHGIQVDSEVIAKGKSATVGVSDDFIGSVIDAYGNCLNNESRKFDISTEWPLYGYSKNPLKREKISEIFETGISAIDGFASVGIGQRIGVFAGSGVGKSTLLKMIVSSSSSDVNVIALIGERGREVLDFVECEEIASIIKKSVVIVASADQPALVRARAAYAAMSISEYFAEKGANVMLAMDSITRFAMALRETSLAAGEVPTARGYTPSTFSALPKLIERAGNFKSHGSITGFFTVLVEGEDFNEPITDNLRAILDGHIILKRELANKGQFPPVDILSSLSRLQEKVIDEKKMGIVKKIKSLFSVYKESYDLVELGAYEKGSNSSFDEALSKVPLINSYLKQSVDEKRGVEEIFRKLNGFVS